MVHCKQQDTATDERRRLDNKLSPSLKSRHWQETASCKVLALHSPLGEQDRGAQQLMREDRRTMETKVLGLEPRHSMGAPKPSCGAMEASGGDGVGAARSVAHKLATDLRWHERCISAISSCSCSCWIYTAGDSTQSRKISPGRGRGRGPPRGPQAHGLALQSGSVLADSSVRSASGYRNDDSNEANGLQLDATIQW